MLHDACEPAIFLHKKSKNMNLRHYLRYIFLACGIAACTLLATAQEPPKTVLIGFAGPLSGSAAAMGKSMEVAAQIAINDANAQKLKIAGQPVLFKLLSQDDRGDSRTATLIADYLVKSNVVGVIGHWNTGASIPASKIYHAAGIPQIAPGSTGHQYTQSGYANTFRIVGHDDDGGTYAGRYTTDQLKTSRIAVIDDGTGFGVSLADRFTKTAIEAGAAVIGRESVNNKTADFNAALGNLQTKKPELIFFGGLGPQAAVLARSIKRLNLNARLLAADGTVGPMFLQLAGADGNGSLGMAPGQPREKMTGWKTFEKKYHALDSNEIEFYAPFSYDATLTLVAAIRQANSLEPEKVVTALRNIRYSGLTGTIAFDHEGNLSNAAYTIYEVQNQKWVAIKTFSNTR